MVLPEEVIASTVIYMGLIHGANPTSGWLLSVHRGMMNKSRGEVFITVGLLGAGHTLAMLSLLPISIATSWLNSVTAPASAVALIAFGAYRLLRRTHWYFGLKRSRLEMIPLGAALGVVHGSIPSVMPFFALYCSIYGGATGSLTGGLYMIALHSTASVLVMASFAASVYLVLGIGSLKRLWIDFDRIWSLILVGIGAWVFASWIFNH
ncbi:MAG: hypothetical protein NZ988_01570 [Thaumarchaeota archaeon]|nr:hypothetical protein [Candidatus Calditenuaceae archaeon]MDW8186723.1 hypothetical protein [Nitrososphaerota archaeon]